MTVVKIRAFLYSLLKFAFSVFLLLLWGDWFPEHFCRGDQRETSYKKVEGQHTLISLLSHHYLIPILCYHQFKDTWPTQKRHKTTGQILGHSVLMQNCRSIHQNSTMYVILYDSCINKKFKYSEKENSEFNYYHAFYIVTVDCHCFYCKLSSFDDRLNYNNAFFWLSFYS